MNDIIEAVERLKDHPDFITFLTCIREYREQAIGDMKHDNCVKEPAIMARNLGYVCAMDTILETADAALQQE